MINPFNSNFFRFSLGFALILSVSFGVLFFVGQSVEVEDGSGRESAVSKDTDR